MKYDTCFQNSPYLPWRLKFGHLGASGYQIYFSVYRVDQHTDLLNVLKARITLIRAV